MPIEVVPHPDRPEAFALVSGYRRLQVFEEIVGMGLDTFRSIPAIVRPADTRANHLAAIVEENEIRADLSPWERGRIVVMAQRMEIFDTVEAAIETLFHGASRQKQHRLRSLARVFEELDGYLADPELLSLRQCLRIAAALDRDFGDLMRHTLEECRRHGTPDRKLGTTEAQWDALLPILRESEMSDAVSGGPTGTNRGGRPRRTLTPRRGLNIRRERTSHGWCLHFTGREATSALLDAVFDHIEMLFSPA